MSIGNYPDADFTPNIPNSGSNTGKRTYNPTGSFRFWAQKVLPTVYDDSLSYYEILTKVVNYLNNVIQNVDDLNASVGNTNTAFDELQSYVNDTKNTLIDTYNQLQTYVNTYFDSLDVQDEINIKLDAMANNGSLSTLLSPFIPDLVSSWLSSHITPTTPAIDDTLSVTGAGADAKKTGDEITQLKNAFIHKNVCVPEPDYKSTIIYFPVYLENGQSYAIANPTIAEATPSILLAFANEGSSENILTVVNYGYVYNPIVNTSQNFTWNLPSGKYRFKFGTNHELTDAERDLYGNNWVIMPIDSTDKLVSVSEYIDYYTLYAKYALETDSISIGDRVISCIGDSLTEGYGVPSGQDYPNILSTLTGKTVYNAGISGEASNNICGRQGGYPIKVIGFTIPEGTTPVEVTFIDNINRNANSPAVILEKQKPNIFNPSIIDGIEGNFSKSEDKVYFTRKTSGTAKTIDRPTPVFTNQMLNHRDDVQVIWIGTNGGWMVTADDAETRIDNLLGQIDLMIEFSTSKEYIVIGLTHYYSWVELNGLTRDMLDKAMKAHYGSHFIDARHYLMSYGLSDAGITPTEADNTAIASGNVPPSLLYTDGIHGNQHFYNIIANLVYKKGIELGYWK